MSAGERLLLYRATIRARFPIFPPLPVILPDVASGPNVRFVELDPFDRDIYECAATFWIDWLRAAHEHGHGLEALVILKLARLMGWTLEGAKDYLRRSFYAFRGIPGLWQNDVVAANAMGEQGRQAWHPVELVAESVAHALRATWNDTEQRFKERTIADIYPVEPDAMLAWWQAITREAGVTLPALAYAPSPNFRAGRPQPIRYIVVHSTEGFDSLAWLRNPASEASAHYLEQEDEEYQLVDEENRAWHAGIIRGWPTTPLFTGKFVRQELDGSLTFTVNPNDESIGIEMEGFASKIIPHAIIARTAARIREIRGRRGWLPLVTHGQLSPGNRSDPGAHNMAALEAELEEDDMAFTEAQLRKMIREEVHLALWGPGDDPNTPQPEVTGLGLTLAHVGRRIIRTLQGQPRDPGKAYPDDGTPIV